MFIAITTTYDNKGLEPLKSGVIQSLTSVKLVLIVEDS